MKKFLSVFLAVLLLISILSGCAKEMGESAGSDGLVETESDEPKESEQESEAESERQPQDSEPPKVDDKKTAVDDPFDASKITGTKYSINSAANWFKRLDPRMEATENYVTCDWSASGIEFIADCEGDVTFHINVTASMHSATKTKGCYFRAYVDGAEYKNGSSPYYDVSASAITLKGLTRGTHTIRIVKATGYQLALTELVAVYLTGTVNQTAPANRELFIEFVGDSISCGWGLVGNHNGAYTDQDATLAYPYMLANALNADYSIIGVSGQGLVVGNPQIDDAYKYASIKRSKTQEYSFERKADVVIINADTNDAGKKAAIATYINELKTLVEYVREKNGEDAKIVLVCNMMRTKYSDKIEELVNTLGGAAENYFYFKAAKCNGDYVGHPNEEEHASYVNFLKDIID